MTKRLLLFIFILFITLFSFTNTSAFSVADEPDHELAAETLSVDQIISCPKVDDLSSEYENAYRTNENIVTYVVDLQKINYKDYDGSWKEVNNNIVSSFSESNFQFENQSNDFKAYFGLVNNTLNSKVSKQNHWASFSLDVSQKATLSISNGVKEFGNDYLIGLNSKSNTIICNDIFDNCDLAYTVFGDTLKEDIILYSKPSFSELSYNVQMDKTMGFRKDKVENTGFNEDTGEKNKSSSEIGVFYDLENSEKIFQMINLYIIDANGCSSNLLKWDYSPSDEGIKLTVYLDLEFLNDPTTQYPVVIDPTVQGSSVTFDSYASRTYPNTNYYLNPYLRTGCDSTYGIRRTFVKWTYPAIDNKYPISSSRIELERYSSSGAINLRALRIETDWSSSSVTWWNSPNCNSTVIYGSGQYNDWYSIYLTDIAKRWRYNLYPNYGVKIYDAVESSTSTWASFESSDNSSTSYSPKLVIDVNTVDTYYLSGSRYISNIVPLDLDEISQYEYMTEFETAMLRWNNSSADCYFYTNNSTGNRVYINEDGPWIAAVQAGGNPYSSFWIGINPSELSNQIEINDTSPIPYFLHELGHTLGVGDMGAIEPGHNYCVMGRGGENVIVYPTVSDIAGVNSIW